MAPSLVHHRGKIGTMLEKHMPSSIAGIINQPVGVVHKVKLWAKMELRTIVFRKSGCRVLIAFHLNGDDIRNISACAVGDSNIHIIIPVSYTHLDVYKRQIVSCS